MKKIKSFIEKIIWLFSKKSHIIKIDVIEEDIQRGTRQHAKSCPIALAIKRITGVNPSVGITWIDYGRYYIHTDRTLVNFISSFDNGDKVYPFSFKMDLKKREIV